MSVHKPFAITSATVSLAVILLAVFWSNALWLFIVILPLVGLGIYDFIQRKHTILRIYPVIGHLRYLFESIRPEIQQYFVEDDTSGKPISREFRSLVYQRAKGNVTRGLLGPSLMFTEMAMSGSIILSRPNLCTIKIRESVLEARIVICLMMPRR